MSGRAYIHVGSPKTGTTFLQAVLWHNEALLEEAGLRLPGQGLRQHFHAALDVRDTPGRAADAGKVEGAWRRLVTACEGWAGDVVVSHELFASAPGERAEAALADLVDAGFEPHVVLTARDMARQLPAEWQERIKHRSAVEFGRFLDEARDPGSDSGRRLWRAQDYPDILRRWAGGLPRRQVHVVTVPPPGAPRTLLWERFCGVLGLDPEDYSLDAPRDNSSLGVEQTVLLQQLNLRLGERVPLPGPYPDVVKTMLAHGVLGPRPGTPLVLGGDDLDFARRRSEELVGGLRDLGPEVHGDLAELLVPEDPDAPATSTPREPVAQEALLEESLGATADLLAAWAERLETIEARRAQLRDRLQTARTELQQARRRVAELEEQLVPWPVRARTAASRRRQDLQRVTGRRRRRPTVHFLVFNADGTGGVARTTLTVANALADHYDVEVLSVFRARGTTTFDLDPRVALRYLVPVNQRRLDFPRELREAASKPSALPSRDKYSAATDAAMREAFNGMRDGDVLISTRPSLHEASLVLTPDKDLVRIGWDHLNFPTRYAGHGWTGAAIDRAVPGLDALVVLTEADAADYRARHPDARLQVIRNAVPWTPETTRRPREEKVVVAAGRLTEVKGFERLVAAWELLAEEFPDWVCRIYGQGPLETALRAQAAEAGVAVELPGYTDDMRGVLSRAAVFAMSSRSEGFPMSLIEALAEGTPLVSFDCPRGPGEIVVDGSNGLLVPDGDVPGLARALATLMRDRALRERMGEQALADSHQYDITQVAGDWSALLGELCGAGRG